MIPSDPESFEAADELAEWAIAHRDELAALDRKPAGAAKPCLSPPTRQEWYAMVSARLGHGERPPHYLLRKIESLYLRGASVIGAVEEIERDESKKPAER